MKTSTTAGRTLATFALFAFAGGTLYILIGDDWRNGHLTSKHVVTVLAVFGTITAGHLMSDAIRTRTIFAALGFLMLFFAGTGLVVLNSVGRQAETTQRNHLVALQKNSRIEKVEKELARERTTQSNAKKMATWERKGRPDKNGRATGKRLCGNSCKDWEKVEAKSAATIAKLKNELSSLGSRVPVNTKARHIAEIASVVFGSDRARIMALTMLLEPFLWTLFFEFGAIVSAGYAFRHVRIKKPAKTTSQERSPATVCSMPPRGGKPTLVKNHPIIEELRRNGPADSQEELTNRLNKSGHQTSEAVVSRAVRELDGLKLERVGRCVRVSLAA